MQLVELGLDLVVDGQNEHEVGEILRRELVLEPSEDHQRVVDQVRVVGEVLHDDVQDLDVVVHAQVWSAPPLSVSTCWLSVPEVKMNRMIGRLISLSLMSITFRANKMWYSSLSSRPGHPHFWIHPHDSH